MAHASKCKVIFIKLEEKIGRNFCDMGLGNDLLRFQTKGMIYKEKLKISFIKI